MDYITTTDLRTRSSKLIEALKMGSSVKLIHRSQVVAEIKPYKEGKPFDAVAFEKTIKSLNLPKTSYKERDRIYRKHLEEKYGKSVR